MEFDPLPDNLRAWSLLLSPPKKKEAIHFPADITDLTLGEEILYSSIVLTVVLSRAKTGEIKTPSHDKSQKKSLLTSVRNHEIVPWHVPESLLIRLKIFRDTTSWNLCHIKMTLNNYPRDIQICAKPIELLVDLPLLSYHKFSQCFSVVTVEELLLSRSSFYFSLRLNSDGHFSILKKGLLSHTVANMFSWISFEDAL